MTHLGNDGLWSPSRAADSGDATLSPDTLKLLLETAPVAIVAVNEQGEIVYANRKLQELFGYDRDELMGMAVEQLMPERFHAEHVQHRAHYSERPHPRPMGSGMDLAARRKDGSEFPIEAGLSFLRSGGRALTLSSIVDISRRKHTEETLERRVEERTREIERRRRVADSLRDVLGILNSNRPLQVILEHITYQASYLLGAEATAIYRLQGEEEPLSILASYGLPAEALERTGLDNTTLFMGATALQDGDEEGEEGADEAGEAPIDPGFPYRAQLAVPMADQEDIYGGLMLYYREPRRFTAEEIELAVTFGEQAKLAIENARLRSQSEQLAVTAERNRIARDLHDSVTQTLFSASLIAEVLPRLWEKDLEESKRRLDELRSLTRGALAEMRTLLLELRPATLMEVDMNELLRQLNESAIGRARIPIPLVIEGNAPIPPDVKVAFYHIAQEALNNVTKHARATGASLHLQRHPGHVTLAVRDNGRGFVIKTVTPEHLGLTIMRERAADVGAQLAIRSTQGTGTEISVTWKPREPNEQ